jgi:anaerobic magnesium-protoporphyrin IX monomethyl ester cyclase
LRIAFVYPPLGERGRHPLLGQNRQFRYSSSPEVRIYPMVPASAVTVLDRAGHEAALIDAINTGMGRGRFEKELERFDPEMLVLETKTPLMPKLWSLSSDLKERFGTVVFVGDHVSALPAESLARSPVDYVITGGDYDLGLLELAGYLESGGETPGGVWARVDGRPRRPGGRPDTWPSLDDVPFIDRDLTGWTAYGEAYLHKPCTYLLTGRGCGGPGSAPGRCSFCSWQHNLWECTCRWRSPGNVAEELAQIIEKYGPREVFDDNESGMTWSPGWLRGLGDEMDARGIVGETMISSNSRADALTKETCGLLSKLGFRLLKVGLESGNDGTLARIGKMETALDIERGIKNAKDAGLNILITSMVGYPWEGSEDVEATYHMARRLMRYKARIGDSLQASVVIPYPGTPLHRTALEEGFFRIDPSDYSAYDMSSPVLRSPIRVTEWCGRIWRLHLDPVFLLRCLGSLRKLDQLNLLRGGMSSLLGHISDF